MLSPRLRLAAPILTAVLAVACGGQDAAYNRPATAPFQPTGADEDMSNRVKAGLLDDPLIKAFGIEVEARDGVVYLSGTVTDEPEKERAIELARATEGVKDVRSKLTIRKI